MQFVVFGTGPQGLGPRGAEFRKRLSQLLAGELRAEVDVVALANYAELTRAIGSGVVSVAWLPPAVFVEAADGHGVRLLVRSARHGATEYRAALYCAAQSPFGDLPDLRGEAMAWVDPSSCSGYLFPRLSLVERGTSPDQLFATQTFHGSHAAAARAVRDGEAAAAASYVYLGPDDSVLHAGWGRVGPLEAMRPILFSPSLPTDAICAAAGLDATLRAEIQDVLTRLHKHDEGQAVLEGLFQAHHFEPAEAGEYDLVRRARQLAMALA